MRPWASEWCSAEKRILKLNLIELEFKFNDTFPVYILRRRPQQARAAFPRFRETEAQLK